MADSISDDRRRGDEREYEVPGGWGTGQGDDCSKVVIIITDLTDSVEHKFKNNV